MSKQLSGSNGTKKNENLNLETSSSNWSRWLQCQACHRTCGIHHRHTHLHRGWILQVLHARPPSRHPRHHLGPNYQCRHHQAWNFQAGKCNKRVNNGKLACLRENEICYWDGRDIKSTSRATGATVWSRTILASFGFELEIWHEPISPALATTTVYVSEYKRMLITLLQR